MEDWVLYCLAVSVVISLVGSVAIVRTVQKGRPKKDKKAVQNDRRSFFQNKFGKAWLFWAVLWPAVCVVFGGITLYQSTQGTMERRLGNIMGIGVGLVFFIIGMAILYKSNQRRVLATAATTATVAGFEAYHSFQESYTKYRPVYEFYAEGAKRRVTSRYTVRRDLVKKGQEEELYYAPGRPELIYTPKQEKTVVRMALVLCGIGVFFPLIAIAAPWIDPYIS